MNNRKAYQIMARLLVLIKPLIPIMVLAILLGTIGYLCAIFLTIFAAEAILRVLTVKPFNTVLIIMVVIAVARGLFHYLEQYCNHYVAFKLLAIIRHQVFEALQRLCPAKLEGKDKGNLISLITTDIELLEVFYAHTISPIAIAFLTSLIMLLFLSQYSLLASGIALLTYLTLGLLIPLVNSKKGNKKGLEYRNGFGSLNSYVLASLYGVDEIIQYQKGPKIADQIDQKSQALAKVQKELSRLEADQRSATNLVILSASILMLLVTGLLYWQGSLSISAVVIGTVTMMGSCGPVVALASLSNNLNQTLASGQRILDILEEEPLIEETSGDQEVGETIELKDVTFAYQQANILENYSLKIEPKEITGIHGASGTGKSTLLKLIMRFWDVQKGVVQLGNQDIKTIPTTSLRQSQSYVTQETVLFQDTIANNIAIGKLGASQEEIIAAAKKAAIHDFISSLSQGYDTNIGELGDSLSGGERQRIGVARAFLHDSPILLLDEPTSNLDSLNEGMILKALKETAEDKTVVLVSHRKSTLNVADRIIDM